MIKAVAAKPLTRAELTALIGEYGENTGDTQGNGITGQGR